MHECFSYFPLFKRRVNSSSQFLCQSIGIHFLGCNSFSWHKCLKEHKCCLPYCQSVKHDKRTDTRLEKWSLCVSLCKNIKDTIYYKLNCTLLNPFPHIDAFCRLCSRQLFENIVTNLLVANNASKIRLHKTCRLLFINICLQKSCIVGQPDFLESQVKLVVYNIIKYITYNYFL